MSDTTATKPALAGPKPIVELRPRWVGSGGEGIFRADGTPAPAREGVGIMFDCPCGKHSVEDQANELQDFQTRVFVHVDPPLDGGPRLESAKPAWQRTGDTFETLTLRPSIKRVGGCGWHGFVTDGIVTTVP
jgi:hypothetical protein